MEDFFYEFNGWLELVFILFSITTNLTSNENTNCNNNSSKR